MWAISQIALRQSMPPGTTIAAHVSTGCVYDSYLTVFVLSKPLLWHPECLNL